MFLMRDAEGRNKERKKQTNNKSKQHNTPLAVMFPKKYELLWVGFEPMPLYILDRALYQLSCQILHLIVHMYTLGHTPFVLFIDLPSPLDREVEVEEEEGVQPELDDDGNVIHRCIYWMLCNIV